MGQNTVLNTILAKQMGWRMFPKIKPSRGVHWNYKTTICHEKQHESKKKVRNGTSN